MRNLLNRLSGTFPLPWENDPVVWKDPSGAYSLREVETQWDFELEGYLLAHCLGTKDAEEFLEAHRVLSLRDYLGFPHCTVLLNRYGKWSPYGHSADLLTRRPCKIDGILYNVLQVRGREDDLARWEFYSLVLDWYLSNGGKVDHERNEIARAVQSRQDGDLKYHYAYMLDEKVNHFTWSYHNGHYRELYRKWGLSL